MTRIVAGRFRGRRLAVPPSGTRPTSDMAREGIFSSLTSLLGDLSGLRFLDLYAGSGAVGLEAWSRGARVTLVESARDAVAVLRANTAALAPGAAPRRGPTVAAPAARPTVVAATAQSAAAGRLAASGFDVVFADPPYDLPPTAVADVLATLRERGRFAAGAIVVVERAGRDPWAWPDGIEPLRERRYGDATVWYGRAT